MSISIRDLQQMSSAKIAALPGPTLVKAGDKAVALLTPLTPLSAERRGRLDAAMALAEKMRAERNSEEEDVAFLRSIGADTTDWTEEEIRKLLAE